MGHDITAYRNPELTNKIAELRLFPSEGFLHGNIYDALEATKFRRSCSGSNEVASFSMDGDGYPVLPNKDAAVFLQELADNTLWKERVYIVFS